jgi:pantoate--beta-alanine ligase
VNVFRTAQEYLSAKNTFLGSLGFVPTMGALHEGHLSLIKRSKAENLKTVCSIFVNPTQFDNQEDFAKYPQREAQDLELLEKAGCDWVFIPSVQEMYPSVTKLKFDFGPLEEVMEGQYRTDHFNGVAIIVSKLFHLIQPSVAYFGRKDLQQTVIVRQLIQDLGFQIQMQVCDTLREENGLAMSSRNIRLSAEARKEASMLHATLLKTKKAIQGGEQLQTVMASARKNIEAKPGYDLQYFEIVDTQSLQPISENFEGEVALCLAVYVEGVRLIDNIVFQR